MYFNICKWHQQTFNSQAPLSTRSKHRSVSLSPFPSHGVHKTLRPNKPPSLALHLRPPALPPALRRASQPLRGHKANRRNPIRRLAPGGKPASPFVVSSSVRVGYTAEASLGGRPELRPRGQNPNWHDCLHCQQFKQWVRAYLWSQRCQVDWVALFSPGGRRDLPCSS